MKSKMNRLLALMGAALLLVLGLSVPATASPGQENYPNNLKWGKPTVCVETMLDSTWDRYVNQAALDWSEGSRMNIVVKYRVWCDRTTSGYLRQIVTIRDYEAPDGTLATTDNKVEGSFPNLVIHDSDIYVDTDKFWANNPGTRRPIICHEMGHSMGIQHYDNPDTCMNRINYDGVALDPHSRDIDVLQERYGVLWN